MKYAILILLAISLSAQETPPLPAANPVITSMNNNKSVIVIDPKVRADDYVQAFDFLRRDKPTQKIVIRTTTGMTYFNVTDLSITKGGTLFLVKFLSTQGSKTQILPLEEIVEIAYSPS